MKKTILLPGLGLAVASQAFGQVGPSPSYGPGPIPSVASQGGTLTSGSLMGTTTLTGTLANQGTITTNAVGQIVKTTNLNSSGTTMAPWINGVMGLTGTMTVNNGAVVNLGFSDTADVLGGSGQINYLTVRGTTGAGAAGWRTAGVFQSTYGTNSANSTQTNTLYTGVIGTGLFTANANGTSATSVGAAGGTYHSNLIGSAWGGNFVCRTTAAGTWLNNCFGTELDTEVPTGSSVGYKSALLVVQTANDAVAGLDADAAIFIGNQPGTSPGWTLGIGFGTPWADWPFNRSSTMISSQQNIYSGSTKPLDAAKGIDFHNVNFNGSALLLPNFSVGATGLPSFSNEVTTQGSNGITFNLPNQLTTSVTLTAGGTGYPPSGTIGTNSEILLYGPNAGIYAATTNSGGTITAISLKVADVAASPSCTTGCTFTSSTAGSGAQATLGWSVENTLTLNPSGPTVVSSILDTGVVSAPLVYTDSSGKLLGGVLGAGLSETSGTLSVAGTLAGPLTVTGTITNSGTISGGTLSNPSIAGSLTIGGNSFTALVAPATCNLYTSGTSTWTKLGTSTMVEAWAVGGGGGGGFGATLAASGSGGAGGGGGAAVYLPPTPASLISNSVTAVVGAAGAASSAGTTTGGIGGASNFGTYILAGGGGGGGPGATGATSGGGGGGSMLGANGGSGTTAGGTAGQAGVNAGGTGIAGGATQTYGGMGAGGSGTGATGTAAAGSGSMSGGGSGGGGGGFNVTTGQPGNVGGQVYVKGSTQGTLGTGGASCTVGGAGGAPLIWPSSGFGGSGAGAGGGGGGGITSGTGCAGGQGGLPGGGGGGGGSGSAGGGAGGAGGAGEIEVCQW